MSASKKDMGSTKLSLHQLSSNLTLAYRRVEDSRFFTLCMAKEGGLRCEDESVAGIYNATATLMCRASTEISYEELLDINERYGSTMDGFSGKDSLGIRIQCLREHVDELLPVFFSTVFQPVFPTSLWRANQLEILDDIRTADDHPASVCYRELQKLIFGKHPYHMPQHGRHEVVAKFSEKRLEEFFTKERDRGRWVIGCVSNMDASEVEQLLAPYLQHWKISDEVDNQNHSMDILEQSENVRIDKAREQTHIALAVPGLNWTDPDRLALELLSAILTGQSGRLFINLRDRDSLAYTVTTMNSFGIDRGLFGAYMACAPEKAERALTALRNEFFGILSVPATAEELQRAKNGQIGGHASEMQRSNAQAMNMALMELYGVGYDELVKYTDAVEQITLADLQRVAARLLREDLVKCVVVG